MLQNVRYVAAQCLFDPERRGLGKRVFTKLAEQRRNTLLPQCAGLRHCEASCSIVQHVATSYNIVFGSVRAAQRVPQASGLGEQLTKYLFVAMRALAALH